MKLAGMQIAGALIALLLPIAAHAQTGKHVAIGAAVASHDYVDPRVHQGVGIMFLYRMAPTGTEANGKSIADKSFRRLPSLRQRDRNDASEARAVGASNAGPVHDER